MSSVLRKGAKIGIENLSFGPTFEISIEFWQNLIKLGFKSRKKIKTILGT